MDSTDPAVDPGPRPFRILFVCTGNVHRSASAELLSATAFARLLGTAGSAVELSSAGSQACAGQPPDHATIPALIAFGVPEAAVESFRSRQLSGRQVAAADLVLVAEAEHRRSVWRLDVFARRRTFTVLEFAGLLADLGAHGSPPGGGDPGDYRDNRQDGTPNPGLERGDYRDNRHGVGPSGARGLVAGTAAVRELVAGAGAVRELVARADAVREPRRLADRGYDAAVPGIPDPAGETVEATTAAINRIADALQPVWLAIAAGIGPPRDARPAAPGPVGPAGTGTTCRDRYDGPGPLRPAGIDRMTP